MNIYNIFNVKTRSPYVKYKIILLLTYLIKFIQKYEIPLKI